MGQELLDGRGHTRFQASGGGHTGDAQRTAQSRGLARSAWPAYWMSLCCRSPLMSHPTPPHPSSLPTPFALGRAGPAAALAAVVLPCAAPRPVPHLGSGLVPTRRAAARHPQGAHACAVRVCVHGCVALHCIASRCMALHGAACRGGLQHAICRGWAVCAVRLGGRGHAARVFVCGVVRCKAQQPDQAGACATLASSCLVCCVVLRSYFCDAAFQRHVKWPCRRRHPIIYQPDSSVC